MRKKCQAGGRDVSFDNPSAGCYNGEKTTGGVNVRKQFRILVCFLLFFCLPVLARAENAREMDTDPQTQALILGAVQRRTVGTVMTILVMGIVYPLFLLGKDGQMGLLIQYPLRFFALFAFVLWFLSLSLLGCRHYRQLRQHLQTGQALDHHKPWRPLARRNLAGSLITAVVIVLLAVQVVLAVIIPA